MKLEAELATSVSSDQAMVRRIIQMLAVLNNNLAAEAEDAEPAQAAAKLIEILQRTAGEKKNFTSLRKSLAACRSFSAR